MPVSPLLNCDGLHVSPGVGEVDCQGSAAIAVTFFNSNILIVPFLVSATTAGVTEHEYVTLFPFFWTTRTFSRYGEPPFSWHISVMPQSDVAVLGFTIRSYQPAPPAVRAK